MTKPVFKLSGADGSDAGIEWLVSHSGRTVASTVEWQDMLERAGRDYDVLVVGYASRFSRDARTAFNARHDLHSRDATLLFADERLLSSDDDSWDYWAKEAVEAESYSRRMGRRVREGLEAKRRRLGTPGGNRPPFGFGREGRPPILVVDPERMGSCGRPTSWAQLGCSTARSRPASASS